jgi:hypothetical protein
MIGNTAFRTITRVLRWSSTGNAAARPESRPASHGALQASPQQSVIAPLSDPVPRSSGLKHKAVAHMRRLPGRSAMIKSP